MAKIRLDQMIVSKGLAGSKAQAQALILAGEVSVDGKMIDKAGTTVPEDAVIVIKETCPYVSRGGLKLEKAYREFKLNFGDKIVCDIGSSTGGFTDFSLKKGAKKVYAIDVGYGQLAQKLRQDPRVSVYEKTDFRKLKCLPAEIDFFLIDVSFISLNLVLPHLKELVHYQTRVVALIKPQFEAGPKEVSRGKGVIKDQIVRDEAIERVNFNAQKLGFKVKGITESPIKGAKGNREYFIYLSLESRKGGRNGTRLTVGSGPGF